MIKTAFVFGPYLMLLVTLAAFVRRCRPRGLFRNVWGVVLFLCFSKFLAYRILGGDAFNPLLPEVVIWIWNGLYSGAVILGVLAVLTFFFEFPKREWILPVVAVGLAAWGVWNGIRPPIVHEVDLAYEDLPASLEGYRIVQLSDLHVSSAARRWRTEKIVEAANACGGDLIVVTGDLVDGLPCERENDMEPLSGLRARDGVYAVTGNHEGYFKYPLWRPHYERWGIRFLSDGCAFPHAGLALGGVDDPAVARRIVRARIFAAATNGEFRVLLQHRPGGASDNAHLMSVRLQLSGHTHGGVFPGMASLVKECNGGFVRGLYELVDKPRSCLYVSPGSGQWAGFPIRFFNPPEITVFKFRRCRPEMLMRVETDEHGLQGTDSERRTGK